MTTSSHIMLGASSFPRIQNIIIHLSNPMSVYLLGRMLYDRITTARTINLEIRSVVYGKLLFIVVFVIRRKYTTAFAALELYRFMLRSAQFNNLYRHDSSSMLMGVPTVPTLPFESVASKISPGMGYLYLNMR